MELKIPETVPAPPPERAAYTVREFITRVFPMGRATFYDEVRKGRIRIFKRGFRTYVPADEGRDLVRRLLADRASGQEVG